MSSVIRHWLPMILIMGLIVLPVRVIWALDLELTQGTSQRLPLALVAFAEPENLGFSQIIHDDLSNTGEFRWVDHERSQNPYNEGQIDYSYWRGVGANNLIVGRVTASHGGQYLVKAQLLDPLSRTHLLLTREYQVPAKQLRALAHHLSNLFYQQLTGVRGVFTTRIAYITVQRATRRRPAEFRLNVCDYDGANPQVLLTSRDPIMSPAWSHKGDRIAYVSFEHQRAEIYVVDIHSGQRKLVSTYPGINGAPTWSPDDSQLALVLSKSGSPKIYTLALADGKLQQVTAGNAIDTEPAFSADGQHLLFTSNRGGSPQIYEYEFKGGKVKRLSYEGKYNTSGEYVNRHQLVVLHKDQGNFSVSLLNTLRGDVSLLTNSSFDESPSLSPNKKMVVFATQVEGKSVLNVLSLNGEVEFTLPLSAMDEIKEPAWSPYFN